MLPFMPLHAATVTFYTGQNNYANEYESQQVFYLYLLPYGR